MFDNQNPPRLFALLSGRLRGDVAAEAARQTFSFSRCHLVFKPALHAGKLRGGGNFAKPDDACPERHPEINSRNIKTRQRVHPTGDAPRTIGKPAHAKGRRPAAMQMHLLALRAGMGVASMHPQPTRLPWRYPANRSPRQD